MTELYSAVPRLRVDGAPPEEGVEALVAAVAVDERLGLPTMIAVTLRDPALRVVDDARVRVGATLEVGAAALGSTREIQVGAVEVTSIEAAYTPDANHVVIRGYDVSHRLHRARRTRSFQDVTDGEVLRTVAEQAGLEPGQVDDPGIVHRQLAQLGETDWEFLSTRAQETRRVLRVRDSRLDLLETPSAAEAPEPGVLASGQPRQLVLGREVEAFRGRLSATETPAEVEVRAWSAELKQAMTARSPVAAPGVELREGPEELAARFGTGTWTWADRPLETQGEVESVAAALASAVGSEFATGTVTVTGDPTLRAGDPVSLGLAGSTFSGRWTVTAARHTFDSRGYRTTLELGGAADATVLPGAGRRADGSGRVGGVVPGVVTDVDDSDESARVRVSLPLLSKDYVSDWIRVVAPGAGPGRGQVLLPEVDDEVLVAFEQGEVRRPYVLGGLFNGQDRPPLDGGSVDSASGTSQRRGIVSRLGHRVELDDSDRAPRVLITTASGDVEVVLDDRQTSLTVTARGNVDLTAGSVTVSGRSVELKADATLSVSAPDITIDADAQLTLRGGIVRIN